MSPAPALGGEQVEGHHAVNALLAVGRRRVRKIWVAEPTKPPPPLAAIVTLARRKAVPVELRSSQDILRASLTGAPQGVIAWAAPARGTPLEELLERARPKPLFLVLDGVTDPGNFGAVLRTAACAGVNGVLIGRHRSAPLTPAAVKAAAGAAETVAIAQVPGVPAALAQLKRAGIWVAGLHPGATEDVWHSPVLDGPVAVVLGSEGPGLSRLARQRCDVLLKVPQAGAIGSLNVSAAAAVACFEVRRRRLQGGEPAGFRGPASGAPL